MSFLVEKVNLTCKHSAYTHIFTGTNYICRLGCTCIYKRQEILERNHLPTSRTLFNKLKVILHRVIQCLSQYKHKILHTAIYKNLVRQTMILIKLVDISTFCYYTKIYLPMSVFPDFFQFAIALQHIMLVFPHFFYFHNSVLLKSKIAFSMHIKKVYKVNNYFLLLQIYIYNKRK